MCGISGIYNFNGSTVLPNEIKKLNNFLEHRGPDNEGYWINSNKNVAFGHRRLSILDLSDAGSQPMVSMDNRWVIVLNGEIYNFIEIRNTLKSKGYVFHSESDTEVLLNAFIEWGPLMHNKLNGMWALAIYDTLTGNLFLSRDRFGVKPLYYYLDKSKFVFASEISAIHKFIGTSLTPDQIVIQNILAGNGSYHGSQHTFISEIKSLPGGYFLQVLDNNFTLKEYYSIKAIEVSKNFNGQANDIRNILTDSINLRMRSDVPVGTCLSGGVDSGSIASVINTLKSNKNSRFSHFSHRAFCAAFPGSPIDETKAAQILASKNGLTLDIVPITVPTPDELEISMSRCDGPMHALAFYPIEKLYAHIKQQGITVTLDGQGPDEMLGGYSPIYEAFTGAWQAKDFRWFADIYRTYAAQGETKQYSAKQLTREQLYKFLNVQRLKTGQLFKDPIKKILSHAGLYQYPVKQYHPEYLDPARKTDRFRNAFDQELFTEFFQHPLPSILNQYDRCSMAHGVECRMPFMDYRMVEYVFSLPHQSKVGGGYTKRVLREAMKGILPDETRLNKVKIGFNAPIVDWFRGDMKLWMMDQLSSDVFLNNTMFDGKTVKSNFERFISTNDNNWNVAWQFWPYIHLAWWLNENKKMK